MAGHGQSNIAAMTPVAPVLAADGTAAVLAAAGNAPGTASAARATTVLNAAVAVQGANTGRLSRARRDGSMAIRAMTSMLRKL